MDTLVGSDNKVALVVSESELGRVGSFARVSGCIKNAKAKSSRAKEYCLHC